MKCTIDKILPRGKGQRSKEYHELKPFIWAEALLSQPLIRMYLFLLFLCEVLVK